MRPIDATMVSAIRNIHDAASNVMQPPEARVNGLFNDRRPGLRASIATGINNFVDRTVNAVTGNSPAAPNSTGSTE
jgi:hypothetical protein